MCGPSDKMKSLNNTVQQFTQQVTSEAGTVFGAANTVFNNIMNSVGGIVKAGASQLGFSTGELNAKNAAAVQNAGSIARNVQGATAASTAAIGGGNTVAPAGSTSAARTSAAIAASTEEAGALNQITQEDWATGNQNFWNATKAEQAAPSVYGVANEFNKTASSQQQEAMTSQQAIDTSSNWWKSLLVKAASTTPGDLMGKGGSPSMPSFNGGSVGGVSDPGLGQPSYMPGGGPGVQAPDMTGQYGPMQMPDIGGGGGGAMPSFGGG